jgi:glycosyltransferase involved in cell wall biosynthesis
MIAALPEFEHHVVLGTDSDIEIARGELGAAMVSILPSLRRSVAPVADVVAVASLVRTLRSGGFKVLFTHQSKAGALARIARVLAGGPPTIHSLSMASFGRGYSWLESKGFGLIERLLARRTDIFCTVGSDLARRYQTLGIGAEKFSIVRSGATLPDHGVSKAAARETLAQMYGPIDDSPIIVYVGSLEPRKSVADLPRVLRMLIDAGNHSTHTLLIAGTGPEASRIESVSRLLGVWDRVRLLGFVDDVGLLLRAADAMILLSKVEGLPQVLVQAAAAGLPFVAYEVDGAKELIDMGADGVIVPMGDINSAVSALLLVLEQSPRVSIIDLQSWQKDRIRAGYRAAVSRALPSFVEG